MYSNFKAHKQLYDVQYLHEIQQQSNKPQHLQEKEPQSIIHWLSEIKDY